jgi:hypothetical protein
MSATSLAAAVARSRHRLPPRAGAYASVAVIALLGAWVIPRAADHLRSERGARVATPRCARGRWAESQVLLDLPPSTYLRAPSLVVAAREAYVAGLPSAAGPSVDSAARPAELLIARAGAGAIGLPAGSFQFLNARLLRGRGGRLHLVWGESNASRLAAPRALPVPPSRVGSLWQATFIPGSGWTPAHQLRASANSRVTLLWNAESSDAVVAPSGRIDMVVPRSDSGLLHLALDDGRWSDETLPARALYATIVREPEGELHVALIGEGPDTRGRLSSLLFMSKPEGGRWSVPEAIRRRDARGAMRPRLLRSPDGVLNLIWGVASPGRVESGWVRHLSSHDGGAHWSAPHDLELPRTPFTKWRAGMDQCGAARVLVSTWDVTEAGPVGRVLHSVLEDSVWAPLAPLFGDGSAREIIVDSDAAGELFAMASIQHATPESGTRSYHVSVARVADAERRARQ